MDYFRIRQVASFDELVNAPFAGDVNALCWRRQLDGDFAELAAQLAEHAEIVTLDEDDLRRMVPRLSVAGQTAVTHMIRDQAFLAAAGLDPILDFIPAYPRDVAAGVIPTDVYSFHVDRAPVMADTWLCTYTGAASQGLRNEDAMRHIDSPTTRARIEAEFTAEGADDFTAWLQDKCYDLHYVAGSAAGIYEFGQHNLWRIAIAWPGCPVLPCIHRAPPTKPGDAPRLLLIS